MLLAQFLYLLSLVLWLGSILFFSFIGAPAIFKTLDQATAGRVVGAIFPRYYIAGNIAGLVALVSAFTTSFKSGSWSLLKITVLFLMLASSLYSTILTQPRAKSLREEITAATENTDIAHLKEEFQHTHRVAVLHNGFVLIMGILLLLLTARGLKI